MNRIKKIHLLGVLLLLISCGGNTQNNFKKEFSGEAQGTYYSIIYFDEKGRDLQPEIQAFFKKFDQVASLWEPQSTICKVNKNDKTAIIDSVFEDIFNKSEAVSKITNGSFDFTIGPLTAAWGFGSPKRRELSKKEVDSLLQIVGYEKIKLENGVVKKDNPNIRLDFNAIAKGYSVDMIGKLLESKGIVNYLVNVGGEIITKGSKPQNIPWIVGIEKPAENKEDKQEIQSKVKLINMAMATSGNYRKYYEINGVRYPHTIDPKSGYPVVHSLLSVSVLSKSCWEADAYATAFMVMGLEKSVELLKTQPQLEAYFIYYENNQFKTFATNGFKKFIIE